MLAGRSARRRTGLFLVEGPQSVREAVRHASIRDLYLTDAAARRYPEILADAAARGLRHRLADPVVIEAMSPDAQGVLAVARIESPTLAEVLARRPGLIAVLANVRDPGNAGTVIRAADAMGADAVVLTVGSVDPHNPKTVRSGAGSMFHLPVVTGPSTAEVVDAVHAAGLAVLAADGAGEFDLDDLLDAAEDRRRAVRMGEAADPTPIDVDPSGPAPTCPDLSGRVAWMFGNEAWGLVPADRDLADAVVRIPIRGRAESLNLGTAAAVCLHASARARR